MTNDEITSGETDLGKLAKTLSPKLNQGEYVFVSIADNQAPAIEKKAIICEFQEVEGTTLIISKDEADKQHFSYDYVAAWITLEVHSSLHAVGLTALFSNALAKNNISCNVVAGYYHDHLFVDKKDTEKALSVLNNLSEHYEK